MDFFYMPTKVIYGDNCIDDQADLIQGFGKKALIVTGRTSAKASGALEDLTKVLEDRNIDYSIFDKIMENPTVEVLEEAWKTYEGQGFDFVVGIGGGSPLDACKMIAVLLADDLDDTRDLFTVRKFKNLPVIAIPTTSGTGSETTPYAIITDHEVGNKVTCKAKVFPEVSLVDVKYFMTMSESITRSTAVDAMSHLIEGYVVKNANLYSDQLALNGLGFFAKAMEGLKSGDFTKTMHENLVHASTIAGMVISHSGTGIPHGMGYHLTYNHDEKHGKATALFQGAMLRLHEERSPRASKVKEILGVLGLSDVEGLKQFVIDVVGDYVIEEEELLDYARIMSQNTRKLQSHDFEISYEDMEEAFRYSLTIKSAK